MFSKKLNFAFIPVFTLIVLFQNCGKVKFNTSSNSSLNSSDTSNPQDTSGGNNSSGNNSSGNNSLNNTIVTQTFARTTMNTPVEFAANGDKSITHLSATLDSKDPDNGTLKIIDLKNMSLRYEPSFGFRGRQEFVVTVNGSGNKTLELKVTVDVDNSITTLQPALAVRGIGCIQCHSTVASNIISDFGYGGNGNGKDYFFGNGGLSWNSGNPYGDHDSKLNEILMAPHTSMIVPKNAVLPVKAQTDTGLSTLADYVGKELRESASPDTQTVNVEQKNLVYIGAPTDADIMSSLQLKQSQRFVYYRNDNESPKLEGLVDEGSFFSNDTQMTCDGDLALRGPLLLNNLRLKTKTGCRIYVMGSVFINGPIDYIDNSPSRNLQITATKAISMGLGETQIAGVFCKPNDILSIWKTKNSLTQRFVDFWTTPVSFVRRSNDPVAFGQSVVDEAKIIEAKRGLLLDATCSPQGREVSFQRLLLNAPMIHSRYSGSVQGSIISEYALMSLGALFKFEYDSVFNGVNILPFLNPKTYLYTE